MAVPNFDVGVKMQKFELNFLVHSTHNEWNMEKFEDDTNEWNHNEFESYPDYWLCFCSLP